MNKQVLVAVRCANTFASDVPEAFTVTIDAWLLERIRVLSEVVKKQGIHAVEEFNYTGIWSNELIELDDIPGDPKGMKAILEKFINTPARVELPMLRVTEKHFVFTAYPKHGDEDTALSTQRIEIAELDGNEPVVVFT